MSATALLQVARLIPQGQGLAPALLRRSASLSLDWDTRQKSRFQAEDSSGRALVCSCREAPCCAAAMCCWPRMAA